MNGRGRKGFPFTFANLAEYFGQAVENGYQIVSCRDYVALKASGATGKILVNRVDIDQDCKRARRLAAIFQDLNVRATFFVRLHAREYNPFSFENYLCLKRVRDAGHEIGYHSEVVDEAVIWDERGEECLSRDVAVLNAMLGIQVVGVASHGGMTGLNNLDFWKDRKPADFGLWYEAYDTQPAFDLFANSLYISDSSWTLWKCYDKGVLRPGDNRTLGEHCADGHPLIYLLIHPETYYDEHCYE